MLLNVLRGLLVIALAGYAGTCAGVWAYQKHLVYFPSRSVVANPSTIGLQYDTVWLETADHVTVEAWIVRSHVDRPWVLFCHGNGGNLSDCVEQLKFFHGIGCNVMAFDYRGYGNSGGSANEEGLYRDAAACWDHLVAVEHVDPHHLVVMGESLGGGVACGLASQHLPAGLILLSTFCSVVDEGKHDYPWLPVQWLANQRFPSAERVARLSCPKLIMHSPHDALIPYASGQALYAAAIEPKVFYETSGWHGQSPLQKEPGYTKVVRDFIQRCTGVALNAP